MIVRVRQKRWLALLVAGSVVLSTFAADLDVNGDGVIRMVLLSPPKHAGGIDVSTICADLESMIKAAKPGVPVRVAFEPIVKNRTLMGWWYNPDTQPARARLFSGQPDYLLLAETEEIVQGYPEFFFEGVRALSRMASEKGIRSALMLMAKPANTFRDTHVWTVAETVYRVGDGCGVEVIPAAFGWHEALTHNRVTGDSPVKARASAYLTAAAIYCQLTDLRVPKAALDADWTTKKTTDVLAVSTHDAVANEKVKKHYAGPFRGVVRIEPHITKRLKVYVPNTVEDDPLRQNLQFILDAAFQDWFWKTPADWYREGFDRYAAAFDLVYADRQQMAQYLEPTLYTSATVAPTNQPKTCLAVYGRNPESDSEGLDTLRNLETILIEGYDYAKSKGMLFVPYQIAWARVRQMSASLVRETAPGRANDWLTYMLANMIYTLVTDRCQLPPEKAKPRSVNLDHPRGYHELCARMGYETVKQLATLTEQQNTVLLRSETYRIDAGNPGFVGIRLLDRPTQDVRVFCATDVPRVASLSREALVFTPDNYDIEQTVRILPATNSLSVFFHFMASAQSADKAVDGANDLRPFLLNFDESDTGRVAFAGDSVSPQTGFRVALRTETRPSDMVCASIVQHGRVTEEVYLSPDHFSGSPVRLYPTIADYKNGVLPVSVRTTSADRRFNGRQFEFVFRVMSNGMPIPDVHVTVPADGSVIDGPAFVAARAETDVTGGMAGLGVYLGHKRLGWVSTPVCSVAVEQGPPQSRLGQGTYTLWSAVELSNGLVVASEPITFRVHEKAETPGSRIDG
ncbi:MAG: hypothetical protein WCK89_09940 [bacterium]